MTGFARRNTLRVTFSRYWLLFVWGLLNGYVFVRTYRRYRDGPEYHYTRSILGIGLCISRGSASVLNVNCCLLLLPQCRFIHSFLGSFSSRHLFLYWLQHTKTFHTVLAYTILVFSVIHATAHVHNACYFSWLYDEHHSVNWAAYKDQNPGLVILNSLPGVSGVAMLLSLGLLSTSSLPVVRRARFNVFWYAHQLSYLFLLLFIIHPLSGVLKEQSNINKQSAGYDSVPVFQPISDRTWLWILVPLSAFIADYSWRVFKRHGRVSTVLSATRLHGSILLTLAVPNPRFQVHPGQFVLIQCTAVSRSEWHPFTVSRMLIGCKGDWTQRLIKMDYLGVPTTVRLTIDGPYHSPMEELRNTQVAFFIASGLGITPFLAHASYLLTLGPAATSAQSLHLTWIIPHVAHLDWCRNQLLQLHNMYWSRNQPDKFSFNIYVTKGEGDRGDHDSIVNQRLHSGRPHWPKLFQQWSQWYPKKACRVFVCGSKRLLNSKLRRVIASYKNFSYVHESFS